MKDQLKSKGYDCRPWGEGGDRGEYNDRDDCKEYKDTQAR